MGKKNKKKIVSQKKQYLYYLIPLVVTVAVIPLIVFGSVDTLEGVKKLFWKGTENNLDFFSYYKSMFLIITTVIGLLLFAGFKIDTKFKIKKTRYYIPIGIYAVFVILSTLMAEHKGVALYGFVERYEGMYVLLSYLIMMFLSINLVNRDRDTKILLTGLIASASIVGIIGIGQYVGYDLFKTTYGKKLILPGNLHNMVDSLNFTFGKNTIYATMYNTNYVGSYGAMLLPISISLFLYSKNKVMKSLSGVLTLMMVTLLLGSNSRAGYVGAAFAIVVLLIVLGKNLLTNAKSLGIILVCFVIAIVGIDRISGGMVIREIKRLDLKNELKVSEGVRFENIDIEGNNAVIETNREKLILKLDENRMKFYDESDKELKIDQKDTKVTIEDEKYKNYIFEIPKEESYIKVRAYGKEILILYTDKGFKPIGHGGRIAEIEYPESFGFEGRERFASGRGYIWSRTIPMLKETTFVGYGPDTYTIYFPQMDFAGKLNAFRQATMLTDKPHNMYLQIGVNTGVISLLAVLALFGMYFVQSFKIYITRKIETFEEFAGVGIFTAFCGYAVAGLFNDSLVSVAPVFWVLLGIGISINLRLKKKEI